METCAFHENLHSGIPEVAVGEPRQRDRPALSVQKPGNGGPGNDGADRGHGHRGEPGFLRERLKAILRDRAHDLVIIAACDDGLDANVAAGQ